MNIISMKDYAEQKNISYEAVRKQVARYKAELEGHIIVDGRQQFLDEDAVAFLDAKRQKNPVVIYQESKDEKIEQLNEQVKQLLVKTAAQADRISELAQWKADNAVLIAEANQNQRLLEDKTKEIAVLEGFIQDAKNEIQTLTEEKTQAVEEARTEASEASRREQEALDAKLAAEAENEALRQALKAAEGKLDEVKKLPWYKRLRWKG